MPVRINLSRSVSTTGLPDNPRASSIDVLPINQMKVQFIKRKMLLTIIFPRYK